MTLADFYLLCFLVGFLLSVFAVLSGSFHLHAHGLHHGDLHVDLSHGGDAGGHGAHGHANGSAHGGQTEISRINFGTVAAFLAWFGGTGYILARYSSVWFLLGLGLAFVSGMVGAALIFLFVAKVLVSREENLDPADYDMVGVLGRISSPVRAGGTGELVYSQGGTRRVSAVRADLTEALDKGIEVIVTRYEKGIAYVRRWDELAGAGGPQADHTASSPRP
jgi:membrane protein implicated in regulation of membrane protease activity